MTAVAVLVALQVIVVLIVLQYGGAWAQRSPYSLQAAVDELHHREAAKFPLNSPPAQRYYSSILGSTTGGGGGDDYWDDDFDYGGGGGGSSSRKNRNRQGINKALAKYLEHENGNGNNNNNYDGGIEHDGLTLWPFGGLEFDGDNAKAADDDSNSNNNNKLFLNALNEKKRSSYFRERESKFENDGAPVSVFRERESQSDGGVGGGRNEGGAEQQHAELTEQFLREIEETQEREREERYKDALRHLWEKYQQQENELEGDIFDGSAAAAAAAAAQKKAAAAKRMRMPPYYMLMQKKRSYPVLPWLPYQADRKKRFPVAKRSTKRSAGDVAAFVSLDGGRTDERVAKELSELFGPLDADNVKAKKRSVDDKVSSSSSSSASTQLPDTTAAAAISDMHLELPAKRENSSSTEAAPSRRSDNDASAAAAKAKKDTHMHGGMSHKHRKRSDYYGHNAKHGDHGEHGEHGSREHEYHDHHGSHESHEEEDSDEHDHDHGRDGGEEEEEEEEDESEEREEREEREEEEEGGDWRKKKRDVENAKAKAKAKKALAKRSAATMEVFHSLPQISHDNLANMRRKKSIEWSKYFGLDRKKKSLKRSATDLDMKKRSATDDDTPDDEQKKKKRELDPEKLDSMDKKLQSIEDFIIDETVKYTGAHEGIVNPEEIHRIKDHVLSRLATAYSLEKMRRQLEKLKQSVDKENHLLRNVIEAPESNALDDGEPLDGQKRVAAKKDEAHVPTKEHEHNTPSNTHHAAAAKNDDNNNNNSSEEDDDDEGEDEEKKRRRKKKRNGGYLRYPELINDLSDFEEELGAGHYDPLGETALLGGKNYYAIGSNQCPLIEAMAERCRGVDLLSGDINQELLPICGVHQICYLCGTSQVACDYQYLAEADAICGNNNDCEAAARSVLMILRGTPGPQLGPRECLKNTCLYSAMREIGL